MSSPQAAALLAHFDAHRRAMPWRETSDPYAIWVSEVMLQQTRVETVIPYWTKWMARFPTVEALAEADLDEVLKRWEGLGYYSRARNLHGAARMVRERFAGRLPDTVEALRELPGVGEYTAGAVASIAYGVAAPAVDGNVRRVLARLYDIPDPKPAELRRRAAELVPDDRPGDFNQALMELGAMVCTPRSPACDSCPLARWCRARELGVQEQRPLPRERKPVPEVSVPTAVIVRDDHALLLLRRPEEGLLGGLWEFPGDEGKGWHPAAARLLGCSTGVPEHRDGQDAQLADHLGSVTHVFSHKKVTYEPFVWRLGEVGEDSRELHSAEPGPASADTAWVSPSAEALERYALPVAQRKVATRAIRWIQKHRR